MITRRRMLGTTGVGLAALATAARAAAETVVPTQEGMHEGDKKKRFAAVPQATGGIFHRCGPPGWHLGELLVHWRPRGR